MHGAIGHTINKMPGIDKKQLYSLVNKLSSPMIPIPTYIEPRLKKLKGIKSILFDVYGTLLISGTGDIGTSEERITSNPVCRILKKQGLSLIRHDQEIETRFSQLFHRLIREDHRIKRSSGIDYPEVDIREIWKQAMEILIEDEFVGGSLNNEQIERAALSYECMVNPVWPMPGAAEILKNLQDSPLITGIVSNAQFYTELILETLLDLHVGEEHFPRPLLFYSYEQKRAKPSEDFFSSAVLILKKLYNIESHEILYVGNDMLNDIYTASKCGCRTALFAGDKRSLRLRDSDERCRNLEADVMLTRLSQLTKII